MPETAADRPNFVLLFPDQWRGDCLGSLGHVVETPHLDELAADGVTFTAAYSPCPSCIATRAVLATGLTPSSAGRMGYRDGVPWRYRRTLMHRLADAGYQTLCSGKTHFYPQRLMLGFQRMRLYDVQKLDPWFEDDYHPWLFGRTGGAVLDTCRTHSSNAWVARPWTHDEALHPNCWTADAALELLRRRDPTRPFFLQVGFHRPHPPLDPPLHVFERYLPRPLPPVPVGGWAGEFDAPVTRTDASAGRLPDHLLDRARRAYYAQITHLDSQIGRIVWFLRKRGLMENTYVLFASDHGEQLGDHHLFRKVTPFEGSAKVPFIVRPPPSAGGPRGDRCAAPVTHADIMPTLLELAGLPADGVEGRGVGPFLRGEQPPWRDYVHGEHTAGGVGWQFVTDGREKFIWDSAGGREWFFSLTEDPQERVDLAADASSAERVALWRDRLARALAGRGADGLTDGEKLTPGRIAPTVRPELLEGVELPDVSRRWD